MDVDESKCLPAPHLIFGEVRGGFVVSCYLWVGCGLGGQPSTDEGGIDGSSYHYCAGLTAVYG